MTETLNKNTIINILATHKGQLSGYGVKQMGCLVLLQEMKQRTIVI